MKKTLRVFSLVAMMIVGMSAFAQKPFAGVITFETSVEGNIDPTVAAQISETTTEYLVMGNSYRMNANQGIDVITIANGNNKTLSVILSIPGYGKYYIQQTSEDFEKAQASSETKYDYTGEKKEICGYQCEKVIVTSIDKETDEEATATVYVAQIPGIGDDINFANYPGLKGYPLRTETKTEVNGEDVVIILNATAVTPSKKIKATSFLLPSDAQPISEAPADLKAMLGMDGEEE